MQRLATGLRASLEASRAITHNLAAGEARELAVARELKPHFPSRFQLSSGLAVNAEGETSLQQDVLVTDPSVGTPFVAEGNIGVHPIETVAATLQIKTSIGASEVASAVENVSSLKRIASAEQRGTARLGESSLVLGHTTLKPFGGIIALGSTTAAPGIRQAFLEANQALPEADRVNALLVLDGFTATWSPDGEPLALTFDPVGTHHLQTIAAGPDSILFFYVVLMGFLNAYTPPRLNLIRYLNAGMPPVTVYRDRLGSANSNQT